MAHSPMTGRISSASPSPAAAARPEPIIATATRPSITRYATIATHMNAIINWTYRVRLVITVSVSADRVGAQDLR
ncbi:Uncharacterised protein [Mycobacterium tuberculosis]|uniref:Uncharacterized protein n=2 Tax=Mycobacterium tuberculosis TaxID=1773 RepID=A0A654U430_MYCTX|nr:Uncharacterised protein [Mycobacterium tuberculosis]CKV62498.1 Uncharacterised protein [Mycobacterium tuberculosis]COV98132.1 Uncharacterised protein [Mycobacterium tuberculosis]COW86353.1 Uncharacterised protein [Mycobacterium tuberculosis]